MLNDDRSSLLKNFDHRAVQIMHYSLSNTQLANVYTQNFIFWHVFQCFQFFQFFQKIAIRQASFQSPSNCKTDWQLVWCLPSVRQQLLAYWKLMSWAKWIISDALDWNQNNASSQIFTVFTVFTISLCIWVLETLWKSWLSYLKSDALVWKLFVF